MCGFLVMAGAEIKKQVSDCALESLYLRGPDSSTQTESEFFHALFARLAIIQPGLDRQPYEFDRGKVLVCNGEIYNYRELAEQYLNFLDSANAASDIVVLGEFVKKYGLDEFLSKSIGMFALVIIDELNSTILAARDHIGEKPLYYSSSKTGIILSSSLKTVAIQLEEVTIDNLELKNWMHYGIVTPGKTLYKEINELAPGFKLTWSAGKLKLDRYWRWPHSQKRGQSTTLVERNLKDEMSKGFDMITRSDVGFVISASTGLDSRMILNLAKERTSWVNVNLVNVVMASESFSEELDEDDPFFGIQRKPKILKINLDPAIVSKALPELLKKLDTPCSDPAIIVVNFIAKSVKNKFKVVITGDGGDELFRGYEVFKYFRYLMALLPILSVLFIKPVRRKLIKFIMNQEDHAYMSLKQRVLRLLISLDKDKTKFTTNAISPNFLWTFLSKDEPKPITSPIDNEEKLEEYMRGINLPQLFLQKSDRGSMCEGVEFRSFFLLKNIIESSAGLSKNVKRHSLYHRFTQDSYFKEKRAKHGLGVPMTLVMEKTGKPDEILEKVGIQVETIEEVYKNRMLNPGYANLAWSLLSLGTHLSFLAESGVNLKYEISQE
jgi:asparagine synthase (glutamine-hydrolysing)